MKFDSSKVELKPLNENIYAFTHDNQVLRFWTPNILAPFGIVKEYDKYVLKMELDDASEGHLHLKKLLLHIEKEIKRKFDEMADAVKTENDVDVDADVVNGPTTFKSMIRKREGKKDLLEGRIKKTEIEFKQKEGNYLKTVFDLPKQTYIQAQIEVVGGWDYRKENKKYGSILNIRKIVVR